MYTHVKALTLVIHWRYLAIFTVNGMFVFICVQKSYQKDIWFMQTAVKTAFPCTLMLSISVSTLPSPVVWLYHCWHPFVILTHTVIDISAKKCLCVCIYALFLCGIMWTLLVCMYQCEVRGECCQRCLAQQCIVGILTVPSVLVGKLKGTHTCSPCWMEML